MQYSKRWMWRNLGLWLLPFCFLAFLGVVAQDSFALDIEQQRGMTRVAPQGAPLPQQKYPRQPAPGNYDGHPINPARQGNAIDTTPKINHQQWCSERYNSYRRSDNTYRLPTGGRVPCVSPQK